MHTPKQQMIPFHASKRGKPRVSFFQAVVLVCFGAAFTGSLMLWCTEEALSPPRDESLRAGPGYGGKEYRGKGARAWDTTGGDIGSVEGSEWHGEEETGDQETVVSANLPDEVELDILDFELARRELNDLVAKSVARVGGGQNNVVFVKTHKTGSTTLASVVYRYGLRHGLRVARFDVEGTAVTLNHAAEQTRHRGERVDLFHYHIVWDGFLKMNWQNARSLFEEIMAEPSSSMNYVTVLRDPVQHWLSYYYFYFHPETRIDVRDYFSGGGHERRPLKNPLAAEFGIYSKQALDDFIHIQLPSFALIMLTEEVDEGLVLLGRVLGWDPIDLTYASLLETGEGGSVRWDDKPVQKALKKEDLDEDTLAALKLVTQLDEELYRAARDHYYRIKAEHSEGLEEAVRDFRDLQTKMHRYLNAGSRDSPARKWYMPESDYYFYSADKTRWWEKDYPPAVAF